MSRQAPPGRSGAARPALPTVSARTAERLRRTVKRLVQEGLAEATLLDRAQPQPGDDRLLRLVAGIKAAAPGRTLQQLAAQLEAMRERTPRGGTRWYASPVRNLLLQAERFGLLKAPNCGTKAEQSSRQL